MPSPDKQSVELKRALNLPLITFYGLGNILGAGIYVLVGKVVLHAGGYAPLAFLLAALLAALTAFSYAELSARFPFSAGAAVYVEQGTGSRRLAALVGLLIILAAVVSSGTILRGFAGYLQVFLATPEPLILLCSILVLGGLAAWGISESVRIAALITLIEIGGLLLIIWVGLAAIQTPPEPVGPAPSLLSLATWSGILLGAFLAFFATTGFEDMVTAAEEVRNPERNLPIAILLALGIATLLYFGVAWVTVGTVAIPELGGSDAPLALVYRHATGGEPVAIALISMLAVINGALIQIIMASRVAHGMARRGWIPAAFGRVHPLTRTPLLGTLAVSAAILAMALWLPTETLAKATSFFLLAIFCLVNLSLWRVKRRGPPAPGIINIPLWVPLLGGICSAAFLLLQAMIELRAL